MDPLAGVTNTVALNNCLEENSSKLSYLTITFTLLAHTTFRDRDRTRSLEDCYKFPLSLYLARSHMCGE